MPTSSNVSKPSCVDTKHFHIYPINVDTELENPTILSSLGSSADAQQTTEKHNRSKERGGFRVGWGVTRFIQTPLTHSHPGAVWALSAALQAHTKLFS